MFVKNEIRYKTSAWMDGEIGLFADVEKIERKYGIMRIGYTAKQLHPISLEFQKFWTENNMV